VAPPVRPFKMDKYEQEGHNLIRFKL